MIFLVVLVHDYPADGPVNSLHDGYYTAEESEYYNGWKEYLTIYVSNGMIVTAEFDGRNSSGFLKSWDMDFMREMTRMKETYPRKFIRAYASELVAQQSAEGIDAVSGATESYRSFKQLSEAALLQAKTGDGRVAFVDIDREGNDL